MVAKKPGFSTETGQAVPAKATEGAVRSCSCDPKTGFLPKRRSLAGRLATTYLLTTLLIVLALSTAVYLFTAFYFDERLEAELTAQADFYATYAANLAPDERTLAGLAPTIVGLFAPQADLNVRFFAASSGALLAATQDIGPQPSRAALMELRYRSPTVFTQPSRDLPHRRYAARAVVVGEPFDQPFDSAQGRAQSKRTIGVVEVSRSTQASERFLATLRHILLVTILAAVVTSLLVSVLLARRLSGPIREMEQATRHIAAGDLDVRLGDYPPDEVGRLAESINYMAERLKHLEAARAQFISEISHDLRTPLTAIKGLLVNLMDASEPGEHPSAGSAGLQIRREQGKGEPSSLEIAERETDRLIRLVNQLLDFSRWQGGQLKLNRRPVDLSTIASAAATLSESRAHHRHITLHTHIPPSLPTISADPDRLQRVILNLLDNAIKFTPGGGQVTLTMTQREDEIEVSVQDTGRGMSDQEQERAFESYYRGEGGGAGLGLTIARAIVEAHGGRMGIESSLGQGTRVWFTLRQAQDSALPP
jgi:signal transduction histidine kinase